MTIAIAKSIFFNSDRLISSAFSELQLTPQAIFSI